MRKKSILALFLVVLTSSAAFAAELMTHDFAAGYYLETENGGPMYRLQLPEDVYRTVRRADLGDIRVFNGDGEIVPHSVRSVEADSQAVRQKENVPFFPLYDSMTAQQSELALHVTRNTAGTIVNIESAPIPDSATRPVSGYLLDLSEVHRAKRELAFFWRKTGDSSIFTVSLQQSNDLEQWNPLMNRATLADLQYAGQKVERRTVQLPDRPMKYLKLTWQESGTPLELTAVTGYSDVIASRQERRWIDLNSGIKQVAEDRTAIQYHSDYNLPAASAQLRFPDTNSIAGLVLQSRAGDEASWITRCEQVFYRLTLESNDLQNEPCTFHPTSDPTWRAVVREDGAGLRTGNRLPTLQLGWSPSELIFLGRGAQPFLLAFGSGRLAQEQTNDTHQMIFQTMQTESGNRITGRAILGKRVTLGGEPALAPPPPVRPWKKWLLWTVLVLGVGLLAAMARSLLGEMKKEEKNKQEKITDRTTSERSV